MTVFQVANIFILFFIIPQYQTSLAVVVSDTSDKLNDSTDNTGFKNDLVKNKNDKHVSIFKDESSEIDDTKEDLPPCKANHLIMITMGFLKLKKPGVNCRLIVPKNVAPAINRRGRGIGRGVFSRRHGHGMNVWRGDLDSTKTDGEIEEEIDESSAFEDEAKTVANGVHGGMGIWRGDSNDQKKADANSRNRGINDDIQSEMRYWRGDEKSLPNGINVWRGDAKDRHVEMQDSENNDKGEDEKMPTNGMALWRGDIKLSDRPQTKGMAFWRGDFEYLNNPPNRGMSLWRGDMRALDKPPNRGMSLWRGDMKSSDTPLKDSLDKPPNRGMSLWRGDMKALNKPPNRGMSLWRGDTDGSDKPPNRGMSLWRGDSGNLLPVGIRAWRGDTIQPKNEMGVWRGDELKGHEMETWGRDMSVSDSTKHRPFRRYGDIMSNSGKFPMRRFGDDPI